MNRVLLTLTVLALGVLACGQYVTPTPAPNATETLPTHTATALLTPTATALGTSTATNQWTATVSQVQVNVREEPGGDAVVGYLESGDEVVISRCIEDKEIGAWCRVLEPNGTEWAQDFGWVFRGCLSDNPKELKCEARP